jgi:small-conductance mechanosensitive channel
MMSSPRCLRPLLTLVSGALALTLLSPLRAQEAPPAVYGPPQAAAQTSTPPPWFRPTFAAPAPLPKMDWDAQALEQRFLDDNLQSARRALALLPDDGTADAERALLERKLKHVSDLIEIMKAHASVEAEIAAVPARLEEVNQQLEALLSAPPIAITTQPTNEGLEALHLTLEAQQRGLDKLKESQRSSTKRVEDFSERRRQYSAQLAEANATINTLNTALLSAPMSARRALTLQLEDAQILARLSQEAALGVDLDERLLKRSADLHTRELDYTQQRILRAEEHINLYTEALNQALIQEKRATDAVLAQKQAATSQASTQHDRFIATYEERVARAAAHVVELKQELAILSGVVTQQEKRLQTERERLDGLKVLIKQAGSSDRTGQRMRTTYEHVRALRKNPRRLLLSDVSASLEANRSLRFALDEELLDLSDRWTAQLEEARAELPPDALRAFDQEVITLRTRLQAALAEEHETLSSVINAQSNLQELGEDLVQVLSETESFILSRLFWIRDAKPLSMETLSLLMSELEQLQHLGSLGLARRGDLLDQLWKHPFLLIFAFLLLPWAFGVAWYRTRKLFFTALTVYKAADQRQRVHDALSLTAPDTSAPEIATLSAPSAQASAADAPDIEGADAESEAAAQQAPTHEVTAEEAAADEDGAGIIDKLKVVLLGLIHVGLSPLFVVLLGWMVEELTLPGDMQVGAARVLRQLAMVLSAWLMSRALFREDGLAHVLFRTSAALAAELRWFLRRILLLYFFLRVPSLELQQPPFSLVTIPRLLETAFQILVLPIFFHVLRPQSALSVALRHGMKERFAEKNWSLMLTLVMGTLLAAVGMDAFGYRFGAAKISQSTLASLVFLVITAGAYRLVLDVSLRVYRRRHLNAVDDVEASSISLVNTSPVTEILAVERQIQGLIHTVAWVTAVVGAAMLWGVDQQMIRSLDEVTMYSLTDASGGPQPVTLSDLFKATLALGVTFGIMKYLEGFFNVVLFPRFNFDAGLRYAILAISRYVVFLLGVLVGLSYIHLDLSRIGWLMAAVGFGLGFGMQEIFSNFVCGIILLLERPVRVGDFVKIGDVVGIVTHINMRATTVTDLNKVEIIVPNKSLITEPLTNWTLANKITRLMIPIGVAYGTDPQVVIQLLLDLARKHPDVLVDPAPSALFVAHGASSLDFELRCFVGDPNIRPQLQSGLNVMINRALAEKGIEIPFPQRDIHIRSDVRMGQPVASLEGSPKAATKESPQGASQDEP